MIVVSNQSHLSSKYKDLNVDGKVAPFGGQIEK